MRFRGSGLRSFSAPTIFYMAYIYRDGTILALFLSLKNESGLIVCGYVMAFPRHTEVCTT